MVDDNSVTASVYWVDNISSIHRPSRGLWLNPSNYTTLTLWSPHVFHDVTSEHAGYRCMSSMTYLTYWVSAASATAVRWQPQPPSKSFSSRLCLEPVSTDHVFQSVTHYDVSRPAVGHTLCQCDRLPFSFIGIQQHIIILLIIQVNQRLSRSSILGII